MIVQIYEISSVNQALACAAAGVDHIGVLVGPGDFPREVSAEQAAAIFGALPAGATGCALSLAADRETILKAALGTGAGILHLGAAPEHLPPDAVVAVKADLPGLRIMRSVPVTGPESVALARALDGIADYLLLDSHDPGDPQIGALGRTHDWRVSRQIVESVKTPCILAGGLGPDNVAAAIRAVGPAGVDSKTRTDRPGSHLKDIGAVRRFVEAARAERV